MARQMKCRDKRLEAAKAMPPLYRKYPNEEYREYADEVLSWIGRNKSCMQYLFDLLARIGYIKYDRESGMWVGVDYES